MCDFVIYFANPNEYFMNNKHNPTFTLAEYQDLVDQIVHIWKRYNKDPKFIEIQEDGYVIYNYEWANDELFTNMKGLFLDMLSQTRTLQQKNDTFQVLLGAIDKIDILEENPNILLSPKSEIADYLEKQSIISELKSLLLNQPRVFKTKS